MNQTIVHSSSVIGPNVRLGQGVQIGPFCVIEGDISIGDNTIIKSHVVIEGRTTIGRNCIIYPFASIGQAPQDLKFHGEDSEVVIGDNNVIREYVTIQKGTSGGAMATKIGNGCLLMVGVHVAHDCIIGNNVICANLVTLAGHVTVSDGAIIGGLAAVHQWARIGTGAMVGGLSPVARDVPPYSLVSPENASIRGLNLIGLKRAEVSRESIAALKYAMELLFRAEGTQQDKIAILQEKYPDDLAVQALLDFVTQDSKRSFCHFADKK